MIFAIYITPTVILDSNYKLRFVLAKVSLTVFVRYKSFSCVCAAFVCLCVSFCMTDGSPRPLPEPRCMWQRNRKAGSLNLSNTGCAYVVSNTLSVSAAPGTKPCTINLSGKGANLQWHSQLNAPKSYSQNKCDYTSLSKAANQVATR